MSVRYACNKKNISEDLNMLGPTCNQYTDTKGTTRCIRVFVATELFNIAAKRICFVSEHIAHLLR